MAAISRLTELFGRCGKAESVTYFAAMRSKIPLLSCLVAGMVVSSAAPTVQIFTDPPSPQPVGTVIGITAVAKDEGEPDKYLPLLRYRFSIAVEGGTFRIVRDFSSRSEL